MKIRADSLDSWKQVRSLKISWIPDSRFKTNLFKSGFVIHNTIQIRDSYHKARIKPFWSQDLWPPYNTNPCFYEPLIWFPQPYKFVKNDGQTCVQWPPLGLIKSGRYSKVALLTVCSYKIAINFGKLGLRLAVVDRWSLTQVWL